MMGWDVGCSPNLRTLDEIPLGCSREFSSNGTSAGVFGSKQAMYMHAVMMSTPVGVETLSVLRNPCFVKVQTEMISNTI